MRSGTPVRASSTRSRPACATPPSPPCVPRSVGSLLQEGAHPPARIGASLDPFGAESNRNPRLQRGLELEAFRSTWSESGALWTECSESRSSCVRAVAVARSSHHLSHTGGPQTVAMAGCCPDAHPGAGVSPPRCSRERASPSGAVVHFGAPPPGRERLRLARPVDNFPMNPAIGGALVQIRTQSDGFKSHRYRQGEKPRIPVDAGIRGSSVRMGSTPVTTW